MSRREQRLAGAANGKFSIPVEPKADSNLIWLPDELVSGVAGEIPPLELVRQTQDRMTLRLFINLYHDHYLREDSGISRQIICRKYERVQVGQHAQFTVWGFKQSGDSSWDKGPITPHSASLPRKEKAAGWGWGVDLWKRWNRLLNDLGLIAWVPHLVESAEASGEIIHPLGLDDGIEGRLAQAAHDAARALMTDGQYTWAVDNGIDLLVPVPRHVADVQVVGIARLRYRPRTRMTAARWANLNTNAEKHLARYTEITARRDMRVAV